MLCEQFACQEKAEKKQGIQIFQFRFLSSCASFCILSEPLVVFKCFFDYLVPVLLVLFHSVCCFLFILCTLRGSLIASIPALKSYSSIMPTSNRKHFQAFSIRICLPIDFL